MCGCHTGDCHYQDGNKKAEQRAEANRLILADLGIEEQRFRLDFTAVFLYQQDLIDLATLATFALTFHFGM